MIMREKNLDLLRVIASIMVIALHAGAIYGTEVSLDYPNYYFTVGNLYHSITRVSVPIFIMLSGTFLLNNTKNIDYKYHYRKTFNKIIIPTLIFSILYVIYSMCIGTISSIMSGESFNYFDPIKAWFKGIPFYHLWYMYMIIGCYAITPILIRLRLTIGEMMFERVGWFFMLLGMMISIISFKLIWPLLFIKYLGYFILGYSLKYKNQCKDCSYKTYLIVSVILLILIFLITEINVRYDIMDNNFYFQEPLSPIVIISSICMYISFLNMKNLKIEISNMASHTFNIYLFHAGILSVIDLTVRQILIKYPNPLWYIPLLTISVFILSYWASIILNSAVQKIKKSHLKMKVGYF